MTLMDTERSGLAELLATVPTDPADRLAGAAEALVGSDVTVAERDRRGRWQPLAGARPAPPGGIVVGASGLGVIVPPGVPLPRALRDELRQGCVWLALIRCGEQAETETEVVRQAIGELLTVRDLNQVLLSISDRTLHLLDADICGVLLREGPNGDELRMRSCVGHRRVDTARLRMRRGQGVAGLVFLTGEPAKVDDYLEDQTISDDFVALAESEQTRSALAVPLTLRGRLLGVLEVWRRRTSLFTQRDVARMVTLADIATIAIDNARLYDEQAAAVTELRSTRDALSGQVARLRRSATLQRTLLDTVLAEGGLDAVARAVAGETGSPVAIYGADGDRIAGHPSRSIAPELPRSLRIAGRPRQSTLTLQDGTAGRAWLHPVVADGDKVGCVCVLAGGESDEMMEILAGQAAMACSLIILRERAASRARAEALEQVLWDLLQGSPEHRVAARTRAQQMGIPLAGEHRVVLGRLENVEALAAEAGWDTSRTDRVRADVLRTLRGCDRTHGPTLASLRGDWIVALTASLDQPATRALVGALDSAANGVCPGLRLTWGVSRRQADVSALPRSYEEAKTAVSAAHRLGSRNVFLYEELGLVRLLLGSGDDPDLQAFVDEVTGPLIAYDQERGGELVRTLRAFFDADCSQRTAAEQLFVHHKTLRYRLERIKQLTGLDLGRHEDRLRADLALRLHQVGGDDPLP